MRFLKVVSVVAICVLGLSLLASASQNEFGVADTRNVTFSEPMRVGEVLLPKGDYQVLHIMDGTQHIMVFKQQHAKQPVEARVHCQLVPLQKKAERMEMAYGLNAANERVLHRLVFQGDSAQHVF